MGLFEGSGIVLARGFRNDEERANARALFSGHGRELIKGQVGGSVGARERNVCDHQRPFPCRQFRQKRARVRRNPHAPAFGVQDLPKSGLLLGVVIEDKDADLAEYGGRSGAHLLSIDPYDAKSRGSEAQAANRLTLDGPKNAGPQWRDTTSRLCPWHSISCPKRCAWSCIHPNLGATARSRDRVPGGSSSTQCHPKRSGRWPAPGGWRSPRNRSASR